MSPRRGENLVKGNKLVFLDCETSGLYPEKGARVIELYYEVLNPWPDFSVKEKGLLRWNLSRHDMEFAEPKALEINGYTRNAGDWETAPELGTAESAAQWQKLYDVLKGAEIHNQNVNFDLGFINNEFRMCRIKETPWLRQTGDLTSLCMMLRDEYGVVKNGRPTASLHPVYDAIGGPPLPEHRADADVQRAKFVYSHVRSNYKPMRMSLGVLTN